MKRYFIFLLHVFNGTVATMLTGMLLRRFFLAIYSAVSGTQHMVSFDIQSFLPAFICVGVAAGYASYVRVGGRAAFWIFLVPVAVLVVRILTFPSPSVFESGIATGWNHFFGRVECSAHNLYDLAHTAVRCVDRIYYLGAICSTLSYSAGAVLSHINLWPTLSSFMRESGTRRLGSVLHKMRKQR